MKCRQQAPWDPYEILGVSRTADQSEIKAAFKRRAFETHPDRNVGKGTEDFLNVARAYEALDNGGGGGVPLDEEELNRFAIEKIAEILGAMIVGGEPQVRVLEYLRVSGCPEALAEQVEFRLRRQIEDQVVSEGLRRTSKSGMAILGIVFLISLAEAFSKDLGAVLSVLYFFLGYRLCANFVLGIMSGFSGYHPMAFERATLFYAKVATFVTLSASLSAGDLVYKILFK